MKNKHLVLLFLATLLVGFAVRRAPWQMPTFLQTKVLEVDTATVQQIQITLPGKLPLALLRNDAGWTAEQNGRVAKIAPEVIGQLLASLGDLRSIRLEKKARPDSLGIVLGTQIGLSLLFANDHSETMQIGWETIDNGQPATYVLLARHAGIYVVDKQLRSLFFKTIDDFRDQTVAHFSPSEVRSFAIFGKNIDSLSFRKNDSTGVWEAPTGTRRYPDDCIQTWFSKIAHLDGLAFADLFDESLAPQTFFAQITLEIANQAEPLTLKIYHLQPPTLPEEMSRRPDPRQFAPFALHSSQNPANFFAFSDTALLRQICTFF